MGITKKACLLSVGEFKDRTKAGEFRPFSFKFDAADLSPAPTVEFSGIVDVAGEVLFTGESFRVTGEISYTKKFSCDRCLKETSVTEKIPFREVFRRETDSGVNSVQNSKVKANGEIELNGDVESSFTGEEIDILPTINDDLIAYQPLQNLCRDGCKGLCPVCGADLNDGDCGCDRRQIDPMLAVLAELMEE